MKNTTLPIGKSNILLGEVNVIKSIFNRHYSLELLKIKDNFVVKTSLPGDQNHLVLTETPHLHIANELFEKTLNNLMKSHT